MQIVILTGFLGSGKTTILLQLAQTLTASGKKKKGCQVMVLENEIGEIQIDGSFLAGKGLQVKNLFAGCVCCSLAGELLDTVHQIQKSFCPDWLLIETTGVADPGPVRDGLWQAFGLKAWIFTVVDGKRWKRLYRPMKLLLERQLKDAQLVLINKVDPAAPEAVEIETCVTSLVENKRVRIYRINALEHINPGIWDVLEEKPF